MIGTVLLVLGFAAPLVGIVMMVCAIAWSPRLSYERMSRLGDAGWGITCFGLGVAAFAAVMGWTSA